MELSSSFTIFGSVTVMIKDRVQMVERAQLLLASGKREEAIKILKELQNFSAPVCCSRKYRV